MMHGACKKSEDENEEEGVTRDHERLRHSWAATGQPAQCKSLYNPGSRISLPEFKENKKGAESSKPTESKSPLSPLDAIKQLVMVRIRIHSLAIRFLCIPSSTKNSPKPRYGISSLGNGANIFLFDSLHSRFVFLGPKRNSWRLLYFHRRVCRAHDQSHALPSEAKRTPEHGTFFLYAA